MSSNKREGEGHKTPERAGRKRLRAADVVLSNPSAGGAGTASGEAGPAVPVRCTVANYGRSGPHASRHFPEVGRVWQVQVEHAAKPSVTFGILKTWLEYNNGLRRAAGKAEVPTLEGLEKEDGLRLVLTGAEDEHGCHPNMPCISPRAHERARILYVRFGYKQWQCGFYAHDSATSGIDRVVALLQELVGFFAFLRGSMRYRNGPLSTLQWAARDPALAAELAEGLKDSAWTRAPAAAHIFDLHPPQGKAGLALALEGVPDADAANLLLTGNTWPWRTALDGAGVPGGYVEEEAGGAKTYVRMLTNVRVSEAEDAERLRQLFESVLRGCPVLLRPIEDEDREHGAVAATRNFLMALPSIAER